MTRFSKGKTGIWTIILIPVAVVVILTFLPLLAAVSVDTAIDTLEGRGYIVLAAGEYTSLQSGISDLQTSVDNIAGHQHSFERWMGISANQSGNDWCLIEGLAPFQAISGSAAFGSDTSDEAKVIGTEDTPHILGRTNFDVHHILITAGSVATDCILRVIWGSGTMAEAISEGQFTNSMVQEAKKGLPIEIHMPVLDAGIDKVWVQVKTATDNATIDFFVGVHEYTE